MWSVIEQHVSHEVELHGGLPAVSRESHGIRTLQLLHHERANTLRCSMCIHNIHTRQAYKDIQMSRLKHHEGKPLSLEAHKWTVKDRAALREQVELVQSLLLVALVFLLAQSGLQFEVMEFFIDRIWLRPLSY